jgi:hypothetical protein
VTEIKHITPWEIWWMRRLNGWRDSTTVPREPRKLIYPKGYQEKKEERKTENDPRNKSDGGT